MESPRKKLSRTATSSRPASLRRLRPAAEPLEDRTLLSFLPPTNLNYGSSISPTSLVIADFNNDRKNDLAVGVLQGGFPPRPPDSVDVHLGNGTGTLLSPLSSPAGTTPQVLGVGDFNGDGNKDIVADPTNGPLFVLLGNGNGTFQSARQLTTRTGGGGFAAVLYVRVTDLNTGGILQEFRSPFQRPSYRQMQLALADDNGDGTVDGILLSARKGKKWVRRRFGI